MPENNQTNRIKRWQERARRLKIEARALRMASKDPRVPWYAKALAIGVIAYLLSPVDLIPDFIPVLGYLDDIILVPLGFALAVKLIPREVWLEYRSKAESASRLKEQGNML
ncbi:MAG: DUF1232 domain-containing protein [Deltaproteobacteria bacterium]|nr:DUF1232 domain-containing protein [Deltaproteobacteria bacterium]